MVKISELRTRDVINIVDGRRLGEIKDVELDVEQGKIKAIILPGPSGRFMGLFAKNDDVIVPWEKIRKLGVDVILVEVRNFTDPKHE